MDEEFRTMVCMQTKEVVMSISRRNFLRAGAAVAGTIAAGVSLPSSGYAAEPIARVYATKSLDSESLRKMYALVCGEKAAEFAGIR